MPLAKEEIKQEKKCCCPFIIQFMVFKIKWSCKKA